MQALPDRRLSPRESALLAASLYGRDFIVEWAEELLAGRAHDDDPRYPDLAWLRGTVGRPDYWSRVWGARALLHLGPLRSEIVLAAAGDSSWRVREMALKVIAAHHLDDPDGLIDRLVDDEVARVRAQAWRALGRKDPR
jgi:hypothetical protein